LLENHAKAAKLEMMRNASKKELAIAQERRKKIRKTIELKLRKTMLLM
jgi:hypothetical protein